MATENKSGQKTLIFYITKNGFKIATRLSEIFPDAEIAKFNIQMLGYRWNTAKNLIFIMATGIVVRAIAQFIKDKITDPAVVVIDERGSFVISLLGGHIGGANKLAVAIATYIGAQPVVTTASDVLERLSLDMWAIEKGLYIEDFKRLKKLSTKIVNGKKIKVFTEYPFITDKMPEEFEIVDTTKKAELIISNRIIESKALFLRPRNLFVGIGCNRGTTKKEIHDMVIEVFRKENLSFHSINSLATITLKRQEKGIIDFACDNHIGIDFFTEDELNKIARTHNIKRSDMVKKVTGAIAVAEPAALLSAKKFSNNCTLLISKKKRRNVTLAVAKAEFML
jgi:cobalamin biosynthesis protein CbiG